MSSSRNKVILWGIALAMLVGAAYWPLFTTRSRTGARPLGNPASVSSVAGLPPVSESGPHKSAIAANLPGTSDTPGQNTMPAVEGTEGLPTEWLDRVSADLEEVLVVRNPETRLQCYQAHSHAYRIDDLALRERILKYADAQYLQRETDPASQSTILVRRGWSNDRDHIALAWDLLKSGVATDVGRNAGLYLYEIEEPRFELEVLQPTMLAAQRDDSESKRMTAILALGDYKWRYLQQVRDTLRSVVQNDTSVQVIRVGLQELAMADYKNPAGLAVLAQAARDGRTLEVRLAAVDMCWNIGPFTRDAQREALRKISVDAPNPEVRERAALWLRLIAEHGEDVSIIDK